MARDVIGHIGSKDDDEGCGWLDCDRCGRPVMEEALRVSMDDTFVGCAPCCLIVDFGIEALRRANLKLEK